MRNMILAAVFATVSAAHAAAVEVRIAADRLTVRAEETPLQDILKEIARCGIVVRMDPEINPLVTVRIEDRDIQKAVENLVSPYDYALAWETVNGSVGPITRLAEIQIFRGGDRRNLKPLLAADVSPPPASGFRPGPARFAPNEILLSLKPGTDLSTFKRLLTQIGGTVLDGIPALGIYRVRLNPGASVSDILDQLAGHPIVSRAEPNFYYRSPAPSVVAPDPTMSVRTSVRPTRAPGDSAPVAILDSGLNPDAGLNAAVLAAFDPQNPNRPIFDTQGHGTQMALIAAGAITPNGVPNAEQASLPIIPIRAFDDNGCATGFDLMRCVVFAVDNGARVISMSWGSDAKSDFLERTLNSARAQGVILVAAAGNEPTGTPVYPAAYENVIAVSAFTPDGRIWDKSNYGSFVTLSAPTLAAMPIGYRGPPGMYAGTSISAAFVAHVLARYLTLHPDATPQQAVSALTHALTDAGAKGPDPYFGHGALDARALALFLKAN